MKGFCPLSSGSKGNCTFLGSSETKVLIDAGISAREIGKRLAQIGVTLEEIDAILVTHEHSDHILGLKSLAFKMGIPIIANQETAKGIVETFQRCPKFKIFSTGETFEFGDLEIHPFTIPHDTLDPVAFTIKVDQLKLGFCTDLGFATSAVQSQLRHCHYLQLEANHEPSMVYSCARPDKLKQRILSKNGHLSNEACANLLLQIFHDGLEHVHLAHLSSECNTAETALDKAKSTLSSHGVNLSMCVAPQSQIGQPIFFK